MKKGASVAEGSFIVEQELVLMPDFINPVEVVFS